MTIIKINSNFNCFFLLIFFFSSCSNSKKVLYDDCVKENVQCETNYSGINPINESVFKDFNSLDFNKKSIDILTIKISVGYDYEEELKRFYIEDGNFYILKDNKISLKSNEEKNVFLEKVNKNKSENLYIRCEKHSSLKTIYKILIKKDNKLISTFYANNEVNNIDKKLFLEQIDLVKFLNDF